MSMSTRRKMSWWYAICVVAAWGALSVSVYADSHRIQVGDEMPEFTLNDVDGRPFSYDHDRAKVLGVVIVQANHKRLTRIVADLGSIGRALRPSGRVFDCVAIVSGPAGENITQLHGQVDRERLPVLFDPDFKVWGKLGVVAGPTAVVVGTDHRVRWAKAGYSYDFIPALRAQLESALGLGDAPGSSIAVETLGNASERARGERRIHLAQMLAAQGRLETAIEALQEAHRGDPNSVEIALALGELLCRADRNEAALQLASEAKAMTNPDKSRGLLISGCARRQMGQFDAAEKLLGDALALDPRSARILYEFGKLYQDRGDLSNAVLYYRRALAQVFGEAQTRSTSPQ